MVTQGHADVARVQGGLDVGLRAGADVGMHSGADRAIPSALSEARSWVAAEAEQATAVTSAGVDAPSAAVGADGHEAAA